MARTSSLEIDDNYNNTEGYADDVEGTSGLLLKQGEQNVAQLKQARTLLYVSHVFAQFSEQAWQFAIILFLAAFCNYQSMILVSTYGLAVGLSVCLFGARAGSFVDGSDRLQAAHFFIGSENVCVLTATTMCFLLLYWQKGTAEQNNRPGAFSDEDGMSLSPLQKFFYGVPLDTISILLLIGIHIFGPVAQIMDRGFSVAIERDWVVVMSSQVTAGSGGGTVPRVDDDNSFQPSGADEVLQKKWLSDTNVTMRQIDLSAQIVAPAIAGFIIGSFDRPSTDSNNADDIRRVDHGHDLTGAAILVGLVNIAALIVEWICTALIYRLVPALAVKVQENEEEQHASTTAAMSALGEGEVATVPTEGMLSGNGLTSCVFFSQLPLGLRVYLQQPVSMAGLGLALLYFNALSFGGLMTAYLVWRGMRLETIGIWRGISAAVGLAATFVYHYSAQHMTLVSTGMWSVTYQFVCLSLSIASLFIDDYFWSMFLLITGVCTSRIGLWVFDLTVTQLMQEFVPGRVRGIVGGTQNSLNAFFEILIFGLGLVIPDPNEFHVFIAGGFVAVGLALSLYAIGMYSRAHKFMMPSEMTISSSLNENT